MIDTSINDGTTRFTLNSFWGELDDTDGNPHLTVLVFD